MSSNILVLNKNRNNYYKCIYLITDIILFTEMKFLRLEYNPRQGRYPSLLVITNDYVIHFTIAAEAISFSIESEIPKGYATACSRKYDV